MLRKQSEWGLARDWTWNEAERGSQGETRVSAWSTRRWGLHSPSERGTRGIQSSLLDILSLNCLSWVGAREQRQEVKTCPIFCTKIRVLRSREPGSTWKRKGGGRGTQKSIVKGLLQLSLPQASSCNVSLRNCLQVSFSRGLATAQTSPTSHTGLVLDQFLRSKNRSKRENKIPKPWPDQLQVFWEEPGVRQTGDC